MNKSILKVILVAIPLLAFVPAMAQFDNAFQSTSTMAGSGSQYASSPTMVASYECAVPNRGRTTGHDFADRDGNGLCDNCNLPSTNHNAGTDTGETEVENQIPLGPALPALLLLAGAYTAVIALRRRKQA